MHGANNTIYSYKQGRFLQFLQQKTKRCSWPTRETACLGLASRYSFHARKPLSLNILDASWCLNLSLNWLLLSMEEQQQPCFECVLDIRAPRSLSKNKPDHFSEETRRLVSVISFSGPHFITTSEKKKFAFATTDMHAACTLAQKPAGQAIRFGQDKTFMCIPCWYLSGSLVNSAFFHVKETTLSNPTVRFGKP